MKVNILWAGHYDPYIVGVYSSKELAEKHIKQHHLNEKIVIKDTGIKVGRYFKYGFQEVEIDVWLEEKK